MQSRKAGKYTRAKTGFRFFAGLNLVGCCFVFSVFSASSQPFGGLTAESSITIGTGVTVDSFDSSNPDFSSWHTNWYFQGRNYGTYTNTLRTDHAAVATDGNVINLNGSVAIYGYVETAPGGSIALKGNGTSVGDLAWIGPEPGSPLNPGIQPGHFKDSMALIFSDVVLPTPNNTWYSTWLSPAYYSSGTNIGGTTYFYVITNISGMPGTPANRIYYDLNPALGQASVFVNASNIVLYLTNGISMVGTNALTLNTNSSVQIYSGGTINTVKGTVNNLTQYAPAFQIFGLPTCSSISFGLNPLLTAWLYAPEASLSFNGGGATPYDVVGTFICHDLTVNGHYNFHLDMLFAASIPPWFALQPLNQIVQLGSNATFTVSVGGGTPLWYEWFSDQTNWLASGTNYSSLSLTNVQLSDAGDFSVIVTNLYGSATSAPASLVVYTNATPTLSAPFTPTNGVFQFNVTGVTGLLYTVQASTNLVDWVPVITRPSPFSFVDTTTNLYPQRFYRSVFMP